MKLHLCTLAVAALTLLSVPVIAQNPAPFAADPGPSVSHINGPDTPVGWESDALVNVTGAVNSLADAVIGPGGDLYVSDTVGMACSASASTLIYRVPMNGDSPASPLSVIPYTTVPVDAHDLVFDPVTDALYACGTCDQTGAVYRITGNGVPELLNPNFPLNDPDGIAVGTIPNKPTPHLFVTTQDGLYVFDLLVGPLPAIIPVTVDLSQTGTTSLGNWGFPVFDRNSGTLLAGKAGRPVTNQLLELTFSSASAAVATVLGPDSIVPMAVDRQGVRWFRHSSDIGLLNPGGVFVPTITAPTGTNVRMSTLASGAFLYGDSNTNEICRLDRPFSCTELTVSASAGGIIPLDIALPAPRGNEAFLVVISASGASGGTSWGQGICPVNFDIVTEVGLYWATTNAHATSNWNGVLTWDGRATAEFRVWPGLYPPGVTFNLAVIAGNPEYSSNTVWVHVLP